MLNRDDAIEFFVVLLCRYIFDNLARIAYADCVGSEALAREVFVVETFASTAACSVERENHAGHYHNVDFVRLDRCF